MATPQDINALATAITEATAMSTTRHRIDADEVSASVLLLSCDIFCAFLHPMLHGASRKARDSRRPCAGITRIHVHAVEAVRPHLSHAFMHSPRVDCRV
jgi:hypothetical protein